MFALTLLVLQVVQGLLRSGLLEPLLLDESTKALKKRPRSPAGLISSAVIGGLVVAAAGWLLLSVLGYARSETTLLVAVFPLVMAQDAVRYCSLAQDSGRTAALSDTAWLGVQSFALTCAAFGLSTSVSGSVAWCIGLVAALIVAFARCEQVAVGLALTTEYIRKHARVGRYFFLEQLIEGASGVATAATVGSVGGTVEAAKLQGARLLYGPVTMLQASATGLLLPPSVRRHTAGRGYGGVLATAMLVLVAVPLFLCGAWFGGAEPLLEGLLGETGNVVSALLLPVALSNSLGGVRLALRLHFRVQQMLRRGVILRIANALLSVSLGAGGAVISGATGAAWGLVAAGALSVMPWVPLLVQDRRKMRSAEV